MSRILDVYLHEKLAGQLIQDTSGRLTFKYDADYLSIQNPPPISLSMPCTVATYPDKIAQPFFSGLLPDEIARHKLAQFLGLSEKNAFALLESIGGECAGALALYPQGQTPPEPSSKDFEILDDTHLLEILKLLKRHPLMVGEKGIRLSLAGVQDKLAVGMVDGKIALVRGSTPTTHILKPVLEGIEDSVHNEVFCLRLAKRVQIETPQAEIRWIGQLPYFLIERYDRIHHVHNIERLHQEDFCQILSKPPEIKYEREGGPNVKQCLDVLGLYSAQPAIDQMSFIRRLIFNYLIGNADAHGKNYSMLFKGTYPQLAPAYDILSTAVYPDLSSKMAMKIGGKYDPDLVFARHWYRLIDDTSAARKNLSKELILMSTRCIEQALELKLEFTQEGVQSPLFDKICKIIEKRAKRLLKEVE